MAIGVSHKRRVLYAGRQHGKSANLAERLNSEASEVVTVHRIPGDWSEASVKLIHQDEGYTTIEITLSNGDINGREPGEVKRVEDKT